MVTIVVTAVGVVAASLLLGTAIMSIAGASGRHPAAPAVGLAALLLLTSSALPMSSSAPATVLTGTMVVLGGVLMVRRRLLPPPAEVAAVVPALTLTLVPFLVQGRAGTLGAGYNGDMGTHLALAEGVRSHAVQDVLTQKFDGMTDWYPVGPHSVVAAAADLGARTDLAFSGFSAALCVLLAWTALPWARGLHRPYAALAATAAGMPFLVASYYGQGAFKEVTMALLVLGTAAALGTPVRRSRGAMVPLALLLSATIATYSLVGAVWPVAVVGAYGTWCVASWLLRRPAHGPRVDARAAVGATLVAATAFAVTVLPHVGRALGYFRDVAPTNGTGIPADDVGNVGEPLSPALALGFSTSADFLDPGAVSGPAVLVAVALGALVVLGTLQAMRDRTPALPIAAIVAVGAWVLATAAGQSPYVAAKSLAIASPLLVLLAVRPSAAGERAGRRSVRSARLLVATAVLLLIGTSVGALRSASVGPGSEHLELRSLDRYTRGQPTLFLGHNDFVRWEMLRTPVRGLHPGDDGNLTGVPLRDGMRPEDLEPWTPRALDLRAVEPAALNAATWVVTTRDPAAAPPPPAFRVARRTPRFVLWRRVERVPEAREVARRRTVAAGPVDDHDPAAPAVGTRPQEVPVGQLGERDAIQVRIPPGRWALSASYISPVNIRIEGPGYRRLLPVMLVGRGSRWPAGQITVRGDAATLTLRTGGNPLAATAVPVDVRSLTLTPLRPPELEGFEAGPGAESGSTG